MALVWADDDVSTIAGCVFMRMPQGFRTAASEGGFASL
jgi:hypothetical protein